MSLYRKKIVKKEDEKEVIEKTNGKI